MELKLSKTLSPSKLLKLKAHEEKIAKYQALESSVLHTIQDFLTAALTVVCRDRKLTPDHKDIFRHVFKFGLNIPARLYIEGIAKKAVALIRQNALQACIFHVKEARLYCHQRFVFKVEGDWSLAEAKTKEPSSILLRLENHCYNCLLKLMSLQSDLKDLKYPSFSRWSISLGLREDFVSILKENNILNPFENDPDNHFPWKRTVRPSKSDNVPKQLEQRHTPVDENEPQHQPPPNLTSTNSDNTGDNTALPVNVNAIGNSVGSVAPVECKLESGENSQHSDAPDENNSNGHKESGDSVTVPNRDYDRKDDEVMMDLDEILDCDNDRNSFASESSFWPDDDDAEEDEESSVFLVPIYSFKILDGLIFNIFALDYSEIVDRQIKLLGKDQFLASTKGA